MPIPVVEGRPDDRTLLMRDIVDSQLRTLDGRKVGRAVDVLGDLRSDGSLVLTDVVLGPEAYAGRLGQRPWRLLHRIFGGRHEHSIAVSELIEIGPTLHLRRAAGEYDLGSADRWIIDHVLRFIPGHGK
jgi:hypothetical protein